MQVYSIDLKIYATAYIRAKSPEAARKRAKQLQGLAALELPPGDYGALPVSGLTYDNPRLPDVSLSPAMSIHGPDEGDRPQLVYDPAAVEDGAEPESAWVTNPDHRLEEDPFSGVVAPGQLPGETAMEQTERRAREILEPKKEA